jgi:hypothetical protein
MITLLGDLAFSPRGIFCHPTGAVCAKLRLRAGEACAGLVGLYGVALGGRDVTLQSASPAAMTRALGGRTAASIPALGDRLMVGLQTLTLPV